MRAEHLTLRRDLVISRQETGEGVVFVVEAPSSGRFFRIGEVEHFVARQFDGATPPDTVRRRVEERFGASLTPETLQEFIEKLRGRGLLLGDTSRRLELDRFVSRCKDAVVKPRPAEAVLALMQEAMSDVAGVREVLQSSLGGSLSNAVLFRSSELFVLNTVLVPGIASPPTTTLRGRSSESTADGKTTRSIGRRRPASKRSPGRSFGLAARASWIPA